MKRWQWLTLLGLFILVVCYILVRIVLDIIAGRM